MLVEAYGEHALVNHSALSGLKHSKVFDDFDVRNEENHRKSLKTELQALLDENDVQTHQQLADQLNVTREAVFIR